MLISVSASSCGWSDELSFKFLIFFPSQPAGISLSSFVCFVFFVLSLESANDEKIKNTTERACVTCCVQF